MNQKKRNIRLLVIFAILLIATVLVYVTGWQSGSPNFDKSRFTLGENTVITDVVLTHRGETISLSYVGGTWVVNGKYGLDESMRDVFFAVLSTVEVRHPVSNVQRDSIASMLQTQGTEVRITNNGQPVMSYLVGGNRDEFLTYFMEIGGSEPYLMQIPGYLSYIAGIYAVPLDDWRERYIWTLDWSRLKTFTVEVPEAEPLKFEYGQEFIEVAGIDQMDTGMVMDYLQYAANLQALQFQSPPEDVGAPYAHIQLTEIGDRSYSLDLYELPGQEQQLLGILNDEEGVVMDRREVEVLLRKKEDFIYQ